MKLMNISLLFALVLAISAVGCGKSNNDPNNNGAVGAPAVAGAPLTPIPGSPAGVPGGALPLGCYYNPTATVPIAGCPAGYGQCPVGYTNAGSYCTGSSTGSYGYGNCGAGSFYNGYYCQQVGYYYYGGGTGCPAGTTWSWQYYGCVYYGYGSVPSCQYKSYLSGLVNTYVCY